MRGACHASLMVSSPFLPYSSQPSTYCAQACYMLGKLCATQCLVYPINGAKVNTSQNTSLVLKSYFCVGIYRAPLTSLPPPPDFLYLFLFDSVLGFGTDVYGPCTSLYNLGLQQGSARHRLGSAWFQHGSARIFLFFFIFSSSSRVFKAPDNFLARYPINGAR